MSRIQSRFAALAAAGRKALIPYITAGDPDPGLTVRLMHGLVEAGADILELGVPFSDPMADGPVNQRSSERALKHGVGLADVLELVTDFRKSDVATPIVLMGYANPIEAMGAEKFVAAARAAGVDGVLVVDYPPEECAPFAALARGAGIDPIFMLAPTSTDRRIQEVARAGIEFGLHQALRNSSCPASTSIAMPPSSLAASKEPMPSSTSPGRRSPTGTPAASPGRCGRRRACGSSPCARRACGRRASSCIDAELRSRPRRPSAHQSNPT